MYSAYADFVSTGNATSESAARLALVSLLKTCKESPSAQCEAMRPQLYHAAELADADLFESSLAAINEYSMTSIGHDAQSLALEARGFVFAYQSGGNDAYLQEAAKRIDLARNFLQYSESAMLPGGTEFYPQYCWVALAEADYFAQTKDAAVLDDLTRSLTPFLQRKQVRDAFQATADAAPCAEAVAILSASGRQEFSAQAKTVADWLVSYAYFDASQSTYPLAGTFASAPCTINPVRICFSPQTYSLSGNAHLAYVFAKYFPETTFSVVANATRFSGNYTRRAGVTYSSNHAAPQFGPLFAPPNAGGQAKYAAGKSYVIYSRANTSKAFVFVLAASQEPVYANVTGYATSNGHTDELGTADYIPPESNNGEFTQYTLTIDYGVSGQRYDVIFSFPAGNKTVSFVFGEQLVENG